MIHKADVRSASDKLLKLLLSSRAIRPIEFYDEHIIAWFLNCDIVELHIWSEAKQISLIDSCHPERQAKDPPTTAELN